MIPKPLADVEAVWRWARGIGLPRGECCGCATCGRRRSPWSTRGTAGLQPAVIALCERAGFAPRPPRIPGADVVEAAVRLDGCVGLTSRSAAVSSARDLRLLELRDRLTFPLHLLRPAVPLAALTPVARAFRALARELAARGLLTAPE